MQESGLVGHLNHRSWYKVSNAAWSCVESFEYKFLVMMGDATGEKFVTSGDLSAINANLGPIFGVDDSRFDIDGNQLITSGDLSIANVQIPTGGFVLPACCP